MRDLTPEIELGQLRHALKTLAAHSLRAQLTAISSLAEILRQGSLPDDARDEIMEALQAQNVQLEKLSQEMLNAPQPKATTTPLRHHPVTLKPIIEQVVKDIPPFVMQQGHTRMVGVNVVGMRRVGISHDRIDAVRRAFHLLFNTGNVLSTSMKLVEKELGDVDVVAEMLAFIRASKRGVSSMREDRGEAA